MAKPCKPTPPIVKKRLTRLIFAEISRPAHFGTFRRPEIGDITILTYINGCLERLSRTLAPQMPEDFGGQEEANNRQFALLGQFNAGNMRL